MADSSDKKDDDDAMPALALSVLEGKGSISNRTIDYLFELFGAGRRKARNILEQRMAESIAEKESRGEELTEREEFFLEEVLYEKEYKQRRRRAAAMIGGAVKALPDMEKQMKALPSGEQRRTTSDEWVSRIIRDAEDISDDDVRGLYARILAGEIARPGSFSLKTLSVLRDLERDVLQKFATAISILISGRYLPYHGGISRPIYKSIGVTGDDLRMFEESGLLVAAIETVEVPVPSGVVELQNNSNLLRVRIGQSSPHGLRLSDTWRIRMDMQPLTAVGRELATIPSHRPNLILLRELAFWTARLTHSNGGWATVRWLSVDSTVEHEFDPPVVYPDPPVAAS